MDASHIVLLLFPLPEAFSTSPFVLFPVWQDAHSRTSLNTHHFGQHPVLNGLQLAVATCATTGITFHRSYHLRRHRYYLHRSCHLHHHRYYLRHRHSFHLKEEDRFPHSRGRGWYYYCLASAE